MMNLFFVFAGTLLAVASLSAAIPSHNAPQLSPGRSKRHPPENDARYELEISMIFDVTMYTKFRALTSPADRNREIQAKSLLKKYYISLINAMDAPFDSVRKSGTNLHLVPGKLIIDTYERGAIKVNKEADVLQTREVLIAFSQTLFNNKLKTYDHVQIHTGHKFRNNKLSSSNGDIVCGSNSVSIVSETALDNFPSLVKAALEALGHSLGMEDLVDTVADQEYVMDQQGDSARQFSQASIARLIETINTLNGKGNDCLLSRTHEIENLPTFANAQLSLNDQCRMAHGSTYTKCSSEENTLCSGIKCCQGFSEKTMVPMYGTDCGNSDQDAESFVCNFKMCVNRNTLPRKEDCHDGGEKVGCTEADCASETGMKCCEKCAVVSKPEKIQ